MSIKHIILCIEFVFLAVQLIMARAAYKSPLKYGETAKIVNIFSAYRYTAVQHSNHSFKYYGVRWHECSK